MKFKVFLFTLSSIGVFSVGCSPGRIPAEKIYPKVIGFEYSCPSGYSIDTPGWCKKDLLPKLENIEFPGANLRKSRPSHLGGFGIERFLLVAALILVFPAIIGIFIFLDKSSKKK